MKAILIIGIALLLGGVAFAKYRANLNSVTPGSIVNTVFETPEVQSEPPEASAGNIGSTTKMMLTVSSPTNGSSVTSGSITIKGKTAPNADVFVNESEAKADANGNFSVTVSLDEGENYFVIVANDSVGNAAETELTVTYNVSE